VQDPKNAVDDLPMILVGTAAAFPLWKKRLDTLVLLIGEFIAASRHDRTARLVQIDSVAIHTTLSDSD